MRKRNLKPRTDIPDWRDSDMPVTGLGTRPITSEAATEIAKLRFAGLRVTKAFLYNLIDRGIKVFYEKD